MSSTFYIFRHGETFATKRNSMYWFKIKSAEILPEGIPTLKKIGVYIKNVESDKNFSSEYKRCRQTTQIVTDISNKEFVLDKRLNEYFLETIGHFRNRIKDFLQDIEERKYQSVVICTHGMVIGALKALLLEGDVSLQSLLRFPPPGVLTIIKNKTITEIDFNKRLEKAS